METFLCRRVVSSAKVLRFFFFSVVYAVVLVVSDGFKGQLDMLMTSY